MMTDGDKILASLQERTESLILLKRFGYSVSDFAEAVCNNQALLRESFKEITMAFLFLKGVNPEDPKLSEPFTATETVEVFNDDKRRKAEIAISQFISKQPDNFSQKRYSSMEFPIEIKKERDPSTDMSISIEQDKHGRYYVMGHKSDIAFHADDQIFEVPDAINHAMDLRPSFSERRMIDLPRHPAYSTLSSDALNDIAQSMEMLAQPAELNMCMHRAQEMTDPEILAYVNALKSISMSRYGWLSERIINEQMKGCEDIMPDPKDIVINKDNDLKTRIELEGQNSVEDKKKIKKDGEPSEEGKIEYFTE